MNRSNKPWPKLETHDDVDDFIANADLSEYEWGKPEAISHEFEGKDARVTMRLPQRQLDIIKAEAERRGVKYQRFMRELMERGLQSLHMR